MCLLCVFEPGSGPTKQELMNAADSNPHGYGYAFLTDDRILTGRGMNAEEVIDRFLRIREGFPNTWAMFHARYTTHGLTDKSNCHPFRVGHSVDTVLAHNGILDVDVPKWEHRSDTRIWAEDFMPEFMTWLDDKDGFEQLEDWAAGNKIAIFTLDPKMENNVYIINEGLGHWDNGRWWSNTTYKESWYSNYRKTQTMGSLRSHSLWDMDRATDTDVANWTKLCTWCRSYLSGKELKYGYCGNCKTCLDCCADIEDCQCYLPAHPSQVIGGTVSELADIVENTPEYKRWWEEEGFKNIKE